MEQAEGNASGREGKVASTGPFPAVLKDVCFFAHYDKDDIVDPYVFRYLKELQRLGLSIVFVTPSKISDSDEAQVRNFCIDVIRRENGGLDFGSWSDAFKKYRGRFTGRLLLANDTVYGPLTDLNTLFQRLTKEKADFYGLIESRQIANHLQSWFLLFEPWVAASDELSGILGQDFVSMTKADVIKYGEVGLTQRLTRAGFTYKALVSFDDKHPLARLDFNPMHILLMEFLRGDMLPFAKIGIIRDWLTKQETQTYLDFVAEKAPDWFPLIEAHIKRSRAPSTVHERILDKNNLKDNIYVSFYHNLIRTLYKNSGKGNLFLLNIVSVSIFSLYKVYRFLKCIYTNARYIVVRN